MKVRIGGGATESGAEAVAAALAEHVRDDVEVYLGDADEPAAVHEAPEVPDDEPEPELGPTEREAQLREEIADILEGGPKKYRDRLPDQDKLFVRDRLDLWFGAEDGESGGEGRTRSSSRTGSSRTSTRGTPTAPRSRRATRTTASPRTASSPPPRSSTAATSTSWPTTSP